MTQPTEVSINTTNENLTPVDLTNCDKEPIHIPGSIQPHGLLLALQEPDLTILQISRNTQEFFGIEPQALLNQNLGALLEPSQLSAFREFVGRETLDDNPLYALTVAIPHRDGGQEQQFRAIAHRRHGMLILELERELSQQEVSFHNVYSSLRTAITRLESATNILELCDFTAQEIRRITGLDKVMIYQFDENWNGLVLAEDKAEHMDAYLDLRFPASDIPRQARELYLLNRLRLISDVNYQPVPVIPTLNPQHNEPLDLSFSVLRSVSPIHIEYLKNMGVGASMSVSIVQNNQLWGLIACHHSTSKFLSPEVRTACEFLGQIMALQLAFKQNAEEYEPRIRLRTTTLRLLDAMTGADSFIDNLASNAHSLMELADAQGAALYLDGHCVLMGTTPTVEEVQKLVAWLTDHQLDDVYYTNTLSEVYEEAANYAEKASGLLAISISEVHTTYVLWFRPEVIQTVKWSGDPHKPVEPTTDGGRLHPRKSFALWQETVRSKALPWKQYEIDAITELRREIVSVVFKQAEELAQLSEELQRSNEELESFSYSVSHDLRAPFRHISGYTRLLQKRAAANLDETSLRYLNTISESAQYAGTLVDSLLAFAQMARLEMRRVEVDFDQLLREILHSMDTEIAGRNIHWDIKSLPRVQGDHEMLRLVWRNLVSNAVKYTQPRGEAHIEIGSTPNERETVFYVRDNGVGFDMRYVGKLFGVFQRLHGTEEFEGTGIGLANVRRIVLRHGGRTWAEGAVDSGATFYFSLPKLEIMERSAANRQHQLEREAQQSQAQQSQPQENRT